MKRRKISRKRSKKLFRRSASRTNRRNLSPRPMRAASVCDVPCYHPVKAYRARHLGASGKRGIAFNPQLGYTDLPVTLPCGNCVGCKLDRSSEWAARCVHEAGLHTQNSYITLTYNDDNLPSDHSLNVKHFQDFMKKLRRQVEPTTIRFFHCGEYGEQFDRPHYHALIFGYQFPDLEFFKRTKAGHPLYLSKQLTEIWNKGHTYVGDVTYQSAAYVARYIMKKITGDAADNHYEVIDETTGEIHKLKPEYTTMSRNPGLGEKWFLKYKDEVFPNDFIIMNGKKMKPPRYYAKLYERLYSTAALGEIKAKRIRAAKTRKENSTPERLAVRETVKLAQISTLHREYEKG